MLFLLSVSAISYVFPNFGEEVFVNGIYQRFERQGYWHWKTLQQRLRISLFVQLLVLGQGKAKESLKRNREEEKCICPPVLSNTSYLGKYSFLDARNTKKGFFKGAQDPGLRKSKV